MRRSNRSRVETFFRLAHPMRDASFPVASESRQGLSLTAPGSFCASIPHGFVKHHRLSDSLEIELSNLAHLKALGFHTANEVLAHKTWFADACAAIRAAMLTVRPK
jgi:hypothetical protein